MKRPLLIILGIIVILILIGVWVYVLLTGSPENSDDLFADFGFGDTTDPTFVPQPVDEDIDPTVNVGGNDALRQLTIKPVAGYTEVQISTTSIPYVQYVEAGTGHIFTIDLDTGEETRVSATTIPVVTKAAITPNGSHVLMQTSDGADAEFIIGTLATSSDELGNFALREAVTSFAASVENELLYAAREGNNTVAKAYNPRTNSTRTLFTVPFRAVQIDWHHTARGPHVLYPAAASRLEGFAYTATDGLLERIPLSGFGFSAAGGSSFVLGSSVSSEGFYETYLYDQAAQTRQLLPISLVPEKCAKTNNDSGVMVCGVSQETYGTMMPDEWYQGDVVLSDELWTITNQPQVDTDFIVDLTFESGRTVDLINPLFNSTDERLYFQNRLDRTLWVFDSTLSL